MQGNRLDNLIVADGHNQRQMNGHIYLESLQRAQIPVQGHEFVAQEMRLAVDQMVQALPEFLADFSQRDPSFKPHGLQLKIVDHHRLNDGACDFVVQGRSPITGVVKSAEFRLQWSGEYGAGYHLFLLKNDGLGGSFPTVVDESNLVREIAILTIGRQLHHTSLSRLTNK